MANIIEITDFDDMALDPYARLTENQLLNREKPSEAIFIVESPLVIERALNAGLEPVSFLVETKYLETKAAPLILRSGPDIPVYTSELNVLRELTGYNLTRGVLCAMKRPALPDPTELILGSRCIAVLEDITNPTNMGAIFRSAAALGVDSILITTAGCDPLYRRSTRVSMGAVFEIPWTYIHCGTLWPSLLRDHGFKTISMALSDDSISIGDPALQSIDKLAIGLGSEGYGLSRETIDGCDYTVKIPMTHGVDSLNVAAASAVAFYELALKKYLRNQA